MNNPLAIIGGYAEAALSRLARSPDAADLRESTERALRVVTEEAFRCKHITDQLLKLAAPGSSPRSRIDAADVVRHAADVVAGLPQLGRRQLDVHTAPEPLMVEASEPELRQVLLNLLTNAIEATDEAAGRIRIDAQRRGAWITLKVADNGRGIAPDLAERLFEPFVTDKPQRDERGTGLGLAVSQAIVEQHGGRLRVASEGSGRGSTFTIELPAAR
jgi:signal transduction histidine kinase